MTKAPFVLSAFTMSTASHGNFGMCRHPDDRTSDYTDRPSDPAGADLRW